MLVFFLACGSDVKAINAYQDDAGYLLAAVRFQDCTKDNPCRIWDLRAFDDEPWAVALGRDMTAGKERNSNLARYNLGGDFDGIVAMLRGDNPLYMRLVELNCASRQSCGIYAEGETIFIENENGEVTAIGEAI